MSLIVRMKMCHILVTVLVIVPQLTRGYSENGMINSETGLTTVSSN
jgi:hypothetical protein